MKKYLQHRYLIFTAIVFHLIGLLGMGVFRHPLFLKTTPYHLGLMFLLLLLSFYPKEKKAWLWLLLVWVVGFAAEWAGVHTALLFGHYRYGSVLGPRWQGVPLLIGCTWALVLAGACSLSGTFFDNRGIAIVIAALLATGFDWILEPLAVRLGYWHWQGSIPLYNYACWFGLSLLLAWLWFRRGIRPNQFALTLLLVQAVFFLLLIRLI